MKFKVQSKALYSALSAVSKVINSKNAMTILNNFLFEVDDNNVTITASDIENRLSATLPISDFEGEAGKFCLDARRLVELFKEIPDVQATITVADNLGVNVEFPGGNFEYVGLNGDEYPQADNRDETSEPVEITVASSKLVKGIENTIFAVGTDDLRPQMMGILMDVKPESLTFVATDTRKLVRYTDSTIQSGATISCIIPTKPASIVRSVFGADEDVNIRLDAKSASFTNGTFTFNCRLIKGMFPPYERVISSNNPYTLTVDRTSMLLALRRVAVSVDPSHGLVKCRITPEHIEMRAEDTNLCTHGRETVACSFTGEELVIGFSAPFLIDMFNIMSTTNAIVDLSDPSRPGVFRPDEQTEGTDLIMLLMPMTVNQF